MEKDVPKVWLSVGPGIQVKGTAKTAASLKWQTFLCLLSDYVNELAREESDPLGIIDAVWEDSEGYSPGFRTPGDLVFHPTFQERLADRAEVRASMFPMRPEIIDEEDVDPTSLRSWLRDIL